MMKLFWDLINCDTKFKELSNHITKNVNYAIMLQEKYEKNSFEASKNEKYFESISL